MKKSIMMQIQHNKTTKGCFRYGAVGGDRGVESIYLRKESLEGSQPPETIVVIVEDLPSEPR